MLAGMMQVSRTEKYERMRELLNEKQWRHYLALEAQELGSVAQVALSHFDVGGELQNRARISTFVCSFQARLLNSPPTSNWGRAISLSLPVTHMLSTVRPSSLPGIPHN